MSKDTTSVQDAEIDPSKTATQQPNHVDLPNYDFSIDKEIPLVFTKKQWIVIFNVLVRTSYGLADARIVQPIVDIIEPVVAAASQKDTEPVLKSDIPN